MDSTPVDTAQKRGGWGMPTLKATNFLQFYTDTQAWTLHVSDFNKLCSNKVQMRKNKRSIRQSTAHTQPFICSLFVFQIKILIVFLTKPLRLLQRLDRMYAKTCVCSTQKPQERFPGHVFHTSAQTSRSWDQRGISAVMKNTSFSTSLETCSHCVISTDECLKWHCGRSSLSF